MIIVMSSRKKGAPLPASSAGLLRFFEDETKGYKIAPYVVIAIGGSLITLSWTLSILAAWLHWF